ncbi:MAG: NADH-quinone oxidoreductase subunit N, partial [Thermaceae bacterium]
MTLVVLSTSAAALTLLGLFLSPSFTKRLVILSLSLGLLALLMPFRFGFYETDGLSQTLTL